MSLPRIMATSAGEAPATPAAPAPTPAAKPKLTTMEIIQKAARRSFEGGAAGAIAMGSQVLALMWMRTTINYQYRYGTTTMTAFKTLYADGGIPRFYRGLIPALIQGPLSRFGDTAANTGAIELLNSFEETGELPVLVKTFFASFMSGMFRVALMPVDTVKTVMQVEGKDGLAKLAVKFKAQGPPVFFHGAMAAWAANTVGHYPWFATYNYLSEVGILWPLRHSPLNYSYPPPRLHLTLPQVLPRGETTVEKLGRSAVIGFCSSAISDTCSNSIRVVKVYKQANTESISYPEAVRRVIKEDGLGGLFGRGLSTKIVSNGFQGLMFSVLWKIIDEKLFPKKEGDKRR